MLANKASQGLLYSCPPLGGASSIFKTEQTQSLFSLLLPLLQPIVREVQLYRTRPRVLIGQQTTPVTSFSTYSSASPRKDSAWCKGNNC